MKNSHVTYTTKPTNAQVYERLRGWVGIINSGENDEKEDKCGKEHQKKVFVWNLKTR